MLSLLWQPAMSIKSMKNVSFPAATYDEWKQTAEETLKGKSISTLTSNTYENIKLKPLYSCEDEKNQPYSHFPGLPDFRRGIHSLGYANREWKVAQKIMYSHPEELKTNLLTALEKGQTAISFNVNEELLDQLDVVLQEIYGKFPYSINASLFQERFLSILSAITKDNGETVSGYVGMDPVAILVETGCLPEKITNFYDRWAGTLQTCVKELPNLKTILVDTTPYHNGGANAVQELAAALATGVFHLQELRQRGLSLEEILANMVFQFAVGANFFMETAKLRAARLLWGKVAEAYGADHDRQKMILSAETSFFTKTVHDPHVNLLRAGGEAFAAVLGGVQYLHVNPFDVHKGSPDPFSERIARNTQLILKEEAHLSKVADPAGGSWYVEHLTNELAKKAWELFLAIEDKGGVVDSLQSGWLQQQITGVFNKRQNDIFIRKQSIIGTNIYANLNERPQLQRQNPSFPKAESRKSARVIQPIPKRRLSEPYELLRRKSETANNHSCPTVGLICLGKLKQHKARADFAAAFFAPGGISVNQSGELETVEQVLTFIGTTRHSHYCLCGNNDLYEKKGLEIAGEIRKQYPEAKLYLAGLPEAAEQQEWLNKGLERFIHTSSNCYETLSSVLEEMEARENAE